VPLITATIVMAIASDPVSATNGAVRRIPVVALAWSLSVFFAISFLLCFIGYYVLPDLPEAHEALSIILITFSLRD
jgi:anaerobic C4-dicarboxylate transporter